MVIIIISLLLTVIGFVYFIACNNKKHRVVLNNYKCKTNYKINIFKDKFKVKKVKPDELIEGKNERSKYNEKN